MAPSHQAFRRANYRRLHRRDRFDRQRTRTKYAYDTAGNALTYEDVTLAYNNRGRLKSTKKGTVTRSYVYNALGQMVKASGGTGGTVLYAYDEAGHLLGEYTSTGGLTQETIWLGDIPIATIRSGTPVQIFYVHADHLGTPVRVTRPSDNKRRWQWAADPFGTLPANGNPEALGAFTYNLRFPGQLFDGQAGLHQNMFRDYSPAIGKYVESDPIGLAAGVNTYSYVSGNPVTGIDPLGLFDGSTWGRVGAAAARAAGRGVATSAASGGPENPVGATLALGVAAGSFAYEIYDACRGDPKCERQRQLVEGAKDVVVSRYFQLLHDRNDLYSLAYDKPLLGRRKGSYQGHRQAYSDSQRNLRSLIAESEAMGCPVTADAKKWATIPAPLSPVNR